MRIQKFDILNKPLLDDDKVAYLVDDKNVEQHRQYVEKYYGNRELNWFDKPFMEPICNDKSIKLFLYYYQDAIGIVYNIETSLANYEHYTIYYVTNALITVE